MTQEFRDSESWRIIEDEISHGRNHEHVSTRRPRLTPAASIRPLPVSWLWQEPGSGRIPVGALCIFAGREGTGKSSCAVWLTAQLTRGTLPGRFLGTPMPVLYVSIEESWPMALVPKLIVAGADLTMVHRLDILLDDDEETVLDLPIDNLLLEAAINHLGAAAVVIDPLMSVVSERIDTHKEREVRRALDPLARIADRTGCAILGVAHFSKAAGTDAASLITGSGAFKNVARSIFGFAAEPDGSDRVMSQVKNSLGPATLSLGYELEPVEVATEEGIAETVRLTFTGPSDRHISDLLGNRDGTVEQAEERSEAQAWMVDYLLNNGGEARACEVIKSAREIGLTEQQVKDARRRCRRPRIRTRKSSMGSGWVWGLDWGDQDEDPLERLVEGGTDTPEGGEGGKGGIPLEELPSLPPSTSENDQDANDSGANGLEGGKGGDSSQGPATLPPSPPSGPQMPPSGPCRVCGQPLPDWIRAEGFDTHPGCVD